MIELCNQLIIKDLGPLKIVKFINLCFFTFIKLINLNFLTLFH